MSKAKIALASLSGILALIIIVPLLILLIGIRVDLSGQRNTIADILGQQLQRELTIEGAIELEVSLKPALRIEQVYLHNHNLESSSNENIALENNSDWQQPYLAELALLSAQLELLPILKQQINLTQLAVNGFKLNLEQRALNDNNWQLASSDADQQPSDNSPVEAQSDSAAPPAESEPEEALIEQQIFWRGTAYQVRIEESLQVRDMAISYYDHLADAQVDWQLEQLHATMPDEDNLELSASGSMLGERYRFDSRWQLNSLLQGALGELTLSAQIGDIAISLTGLVDPSAQQRSKLELQLQAEQSASLARLLGDNAALISPLAIEATLSALPRSLHIEDLSLQSAGSTLNGQLQLDTLNKLVIGGELNIDQFDLSPWLEDSLEQADNSTVDDEQVARQDSASPQATAASESLSEQQHSSEEERPPLGQIANYWLSQADIDLQLTLGQVLGLEQEISAIELALNLEEANLKTPMRATIDDLLFRGNLTGRVEQDALQLRAGLATRDAPLDKMINRFPFLEGASGEIGSGFLAISSDGADVIELLRNARLRFRMQESHLRLPSGSPLGIEQAELSGGTTEEMQLSLSGQLFEVPVTMQATATAPNRLYRGEDWQLHYQIDSQPLQVQLAASLPEGNWQEGAEMQLSVQADELGALAPWLGVRDDATGSFALRSEFSLSANHLNADIPELTLADSQGELSFRARRFPKDGQANLQLQGQFKRIDLAQMLGLWPEAVALEEPQELEPMPEAADNSEATSNDQPTGNDSTNSDSASSDQRRARRGEQPLTDEQRKARQAQRRQARQQAQAARQQQLSIPILPQSFSLSDADLSLQVEQLQLGERELQAISIQGETRDGWLKRAPFSARFQQLLVGGDLSLDLRDAPYSMEFQVGSRDVDLGWLLRELELADNIQAQVESSQLSLKLHGNSVAELLDNAELEVGLNEGYWQVVDPNTQAEGEIAIRHAKISAAPEQPLSFDLQGQLLDYPLQLNLSSLPLQQFRQLRRNIPLTLQAQLGEVALSAEARVQRPFDLSRNRLQLSLSSPSLKALDGLHGFDLPPYGPLALTADFAMNRRGYQLRDMQLSVGESRMQGQAHIYTNRDKPELSLTLQAPHIQLDDFRLHGWQGWSAPEQETEQEADQNGEQDKQDAVQPQQASSLSSESHSQAAPLLSLEALARLNAVFQLDVDRVQSGEDWLGAGQMHWQLQDSQLTLAPLNLQLPGGEVDIAASLRPSELGFATTLKADIENFDYGLLARRIKPDSEMHGRFNLHADLHGETDAPEHLLENANGTLGFGVWPQQFEAGILDLWAVSLASAVMPELDSGERSVLNCVVGVFNGEQGVLDQNILLADTSRMRVVGQTEVDFGEQTLSLVLRPQAKRAQIFSLETPVQVKGSFDDFKIGVASGGLIGTTIRFVTSPVVAPLRWIFEVPLDANGSELCQQVWDRGIVH
ncbi:AsmA family protein [Aliagarivorans marinus]|uniref:AsmA family protein n=1 Tax=Aliagarivorans marinus TaxID=561965 RepID=UPI0004051C22|nr:AsmA family protein [Aliagarivorans marinus]